MKKHQNSSSPVFTLSSEETKKNSDVSIAMFVAGLAHELGNPLDATRRYVNIALESAAVEPLTREHLLKAQKGISRIIRILHDLLVYSKQSHESKRKIVEIHSLMEESLKEFGMGEKFPEISVQRVYSAEGPLYVEDRGISIVLQNLYKNAVHAMNGRGTLTVATWRQNGSAGVAVQDTGSGIPESIQSRIFEPFFSTKNREDGTGIGLTLSREIAERCGGELRCENASGPVPGARFILILPRKRLHPI